MAAQEKGLFNYIIIDSALAEEKLIIAQRLNPQNVSLYKDTPDEAADAVAPYLFSFKADNDFFLKWLQETGWGNSWSIFISANIPMQELAKHLKRFLVVKTEKRKEVYFRFYDPRVLQVFLPTCNRDQLADFFGPIQTFVMEDEDPAFARVFKLENNHLVASKIAAATLFGGEEKAAKIESGPATAEKKPRHQSFIIKKK